MKITVIPKEKPEPKKIPYGKIEPGTVYESAFQGCTMLKLKDGEAAALGWARGANCMALAVANKGLPATKILGRLIEIVVEEI